MTSVYDLGKFGLTEAMGAGAELRRLGEGATSLEAVSQRIAQFFYDRFIDTATGRPAFVLARCFKTHSFGLLPADLQAYACSLLAGITPDDEMRCLTLLGTAGDKPEWKSRHGSVGHKAIPLASEQVVLSLPMIAQLTKSLGLDAHAMVRPDPRILLEFERTGFNVFHVGQAAASPHIPAQEWVASCGVRSVTGFGFVFSPADICSVILFSRVHVGPETADLFKMLALSAKMALLPMVGKPVFES